MEDSPVRGHPQFLLRLPPDLRERIGVASRANGKSLNAEIVDTLKRAYPDNLVSYSAKEIEKLVGLVSRSGLATDEIHDTLAEIEKLAAKLKDASSRTKEPPLY